MDVNSLYKEKLVELYEALESAHMDPSCIDDLSPEKVNEIILKHIEKSSSPKLQSEFENTDIGKLILSPENPL